MKTLWWVTWHEFVNRVKKALRRPVTYLIAAFIVCYTLFIGWSLFSVVKEMHFDNPSGLVVVITLMVFLAQPSSYYMYAQRKGIVFKPSHAHYIFNAPVSPKRVLLYGAFKNMFTDLVLGVAFFVIGILFFSVPFWKMLLVFLVWVLMTGIQEGSLIILLYGNERVSTEKIDKAGKALLGILGLLGLFVFWYFRKNGLSLESVQNVLFHPYLQMIPLIGWTLSLYHLILLGPAAVNVICSILCVVSTLALLYLAWNMPCEGGYYEEAAKFADDYQKLRKRQRKGEMGTGKEKYRRLKKGLRGSGASAIFYRHLQEYKKAKFFIFNMMDVVCFGLAVIMARTYEGEKTAEFGGLFLLGILAYIVFCTSGVIGKWEKELEHPYLYLIPEKPLKKMWYATLMEHIKAFIDGSIMCLVIGFSWRLPFWQILSCIFIYVCFQAVKMYMRIVSIYILGNHFGKKIRDMFRILFQGTLMGMGIVIAVSVGITVNVNLVFPILLIYSMIIAAVTMFLAAAKFEVLEQME